MNGYTVRFALTKPDVSTEWDEEGEVHPGSVLLVTFPHGSPDLPANSANFKAKITNPLDMADVLLMVLSFDPSK